MKNNIKILIIDDNMNSADRLSHALCKFEDVGAEYCGFDQSEINEVIKRFNPNVILLDLYDKFTLKKLRGVKVAQANLSDWRTSGIEKIILLTVFDKEGNAEVSKQIRKVLANGVVDGHIRKPATADEVISVVRDVLKK